MFYQYSPLDKQRSEPTETQSSQFQMAFLMHNDPIKKLIDSVHDWHSYARQCP